MSNLAAQRAPHSGFCTRPLLAKASRAIARPTSSSAARTRPISDSLQFAAALALARRCRLAVHQRPCCTVHQQRCRAGRAHAKSEAENIRLLPHGRRRRKFLRHPLLSRHTSQARPWHARRATASLRRQSYPAHCIAAEQSQKIYTNWSLDGLEKLSFVSAKDDSFHAERKTQGSGSRTIFDDERSLPSAQG